MKRLKVEKFLTLLCILVGVIPALNAYGQQHKVSGKIQLKNGKPLKGIELQLVKNPAVRTTTNDDGRFTIDAKAGERVYAIRKEVPASVFSLPESGQIITLRESGQSDPKVQLGFGIARPTNAITEAVGTTNIGAAAGNSSVINPANALYGRIAGLTALENGGSPPTDPTFFVRGRETFTDSNPLVLIDGFEQPLSALSVREIENISVLKDAAALAMYGQRGANGVILVTTKRGQNQSLQVDASIEQGYTEPVGLPNFVQAPTYTRAVNEARTNDNLNPRYNASDLNGFDSGSSPYLYPNVDWQDRTLRDHGARTSFNATFKGGGENARYFAMINYVRDSGIYKAVNPDGAYDTQLKHGKFNFRSNLDINLSETVLLKLNASGNLVENNVPSGGGSASSIFNALYSIPAAAFSVKTPDGNWGGTQQYGNNPVATLSSTGYGSPNQREFNLDASLRKDLDVWTDGLSAEARIRYDNFNSFNESQLKDFKYEEINPIRNSSGEIVDTSATLYGQNTDLNFNSGFDRQRSQYNILGKVSYKHQFDDNSIDATVFFNQDIRIFNGQDNTYHRQNYAANIHYGIADTYFIGLSGSYSGDNLLPAGNRFGLFPAVSAAWIISNENFLADSGTLNLLKLRASWGLSGSDALPTNNPYQQRYNYAAGYYWKNGNNFQGGYREGRLASSDFTYETSQKTNVGVDAGLFNKLNLSADIYYARRTNILTPSTGKYSGVIGINPPLKTNGEVKNKGIETTLTWEDQAGGLSYNIGGTFSYSQNEIIAMDEQYRPFDYLRRTGRQVGQQFGLEAVGFFQNQEDINNSPSQTFGQVRPGDIKYKDQNGDGVINNFDQIPLGYSGGYPQITYSFDIGLKYHGFGAMALFQGTANYNAYLNTKSVFWPLRNNTTISSYYYNHRWASPSSGASAQYPRLTTQNGNNNYRTNSLWVVDRSFLKLRNIEISYELPSSIINAWKMQNIRLYVSGTNLFSIDHIPVVDPERLSVGYPLLKTYQAGLEIEF